MLFGKIQISFSRTSCVGMIRWRCLISLNFTEDLIWTPSTVLECFLALDANSYDKLLRLTLITINSPSLLSFHLYSELVHPQHSIQHLWCSHKNIQCTKNIERLGFLIKMWSLVNCTPCQLHPWVQWTGKWGFLLLAITECLLSYILFNFVFFLVFPSSSESSRDWPNIVFKSGFGGGNRLTLTVLFKCKSFIEY